MSPAARAAASGARWPRRSPLSPLSPLKPLSRLNPLNPLRRLRPKHRRRCPQRRGRSRRRLSRLCWARPRKTSLPLHSRLIRMRPMSRYPVYFPLLCSFGTHLWHCGDAASQGRLGVSAARARGLHFHRRGTPRPAACRRALQMLTSVGYSRAPKFFLCRFSREAGFFSPVRPHHLLRTVTTETSPQRLEHTSLLA